MAELFYLGDNPGREKSIKTLHPRKLLVATIGFFFMYQAIIFLIWESFPAEQIFINRWSWSSADALALVALGITNYVYWRTWNMASPEEANFMKDIFNECRKAGITPKMVGIIIKAQYGDRIKRVNERLASGKCTEEEIIEALK